MAIEFTCNHCRSTLKVPEQHAGKQARCPNCENTVEVPTSAASDSPFPSPESDKADFRNQGTYFDRPYHSPGTPQYRSDVYQESHRGGLILTLGILSLMANCLAIPGIMAWTMGKADLKKMDAGQMDREGHGLTMAGMILGIIGTALAALGLLITLGYILLVIVVIGASAAGAAGVIW